MKTKLARPLVLLLSLSLLAFITGCKDKDSGKETSDFRIKMSNSVTSRAVYEEVNVDIKQISINVSTDTNITSGWFNIETNAGIYDLLDYTAGNDTILAFDPVLEVQTIHQIRLLLGTNNTVVDGGVAYDLVTPSGQTSGIKISVNATLLPGYVYAVILDFDPYKSVVKTGNGKYNLKPVIKATLVQL